MIIKNLTKKTIISKDAKFAKSFTDRLLGLNKKGNPRCLIFETRFGIHTFGLSLPIDVLILDKNLIVKKIKYKLKPNRFFFWNPRYFFIIETPANFTKKSGSAIGDQIKLLN